ncbi:hypothetical protein EVAR_21727_1 [Eumeta japonica]|uniref:Uncharacterized protein n=1 Tax=Eumeta variegata TaxID=151549 RepID=A0A4C1W680_EUMVA|nr:hypothetical protein EVAR_21727_1 [Eumeta japonica]
MDVNYTCAVFSNECGRNCRPIEIVLHLFRLRYLRKDTCCNIKTQKEHDTPTEYTRNLAASTVTFRPVNEGSGSPLLLKSDIDILSKSFRGPFVLPSDILVLKDSKFKKKKFLKNRQHTDFS